MLSLGLWAFWLEPASLVLAEERLTLPFIHAATAARRDPDRSSMWARRSTESWPPRRRAPHQCGTTRHRSHPGRRRDDPTASSAGARSSGGNAAELKHPQRRRELWPSLGNHDGWFDHDRVRAAPRPAASVLSRRQPPGSRRRQALSGSPVSARLVDRPARYRGRPPRPVRDDGGVSGAADAQSTTSSLRSTPGGAHAGRAYLARRWCDCRLSAVRWCRRNSGSALPPATWSRGPSPVRGDGRRNEHPAECVFAFRRL